MNLYLFRLLIEENFKADASLRDFVKRCSIGALVVFTLGYVPLVIAGYEHANMLLLLIAVPVICALISVIEVPVRALLKNRH